MVFYYFYFMFFIFMVCEGANAAVYPLILVLVLATARHIRSESTKVPAIDERERNAGGQQYRPPSLPVGSTPFLRRLGKSWHCGNNGRECDCERDR